MVEPAPKDIFTQSLERCKKSETFASSFYERFLSTSEEIRHFFRTTNFETQEKKLLESLTLSAEAVDGKSVALMHLSERAKTHNRHHLNIEPKHYDTWLICIVETAKAHDPEWTPETEGAWIKMLSHVIEYMTRRY